MLLLELNLFEENITETMQVMPPRSNEHRYTIKRTLPQPEREMASQLVRLQTSRTRLFLSRGPFAIQRISAVISCNGNYKYDFA